MERGRLLIMSLLATAFFSSCTNTEEPVTDGAAEAIVVSAGIAEATRAVIGGGYTNDLEVSFARLDNPDNTNAAWNSAIDAVRTGGAGNTALTFEPEQSYLTEEGKSVLIGYYPRKALNNGTANPVSVSYTITGDEDIMATGVQTGSLVSKFSSFTFSHLLTQLQFKCVGSAEAITKWTKITSITVKNVATGLRLSLDKTSGAKLTATGSANQNLTVKSCPQTVSGADAATPPIGYLLLYPVADLGTAGTPIGLEIKATYSGSEKTLSVPVVNIAGGAEAGHSHLITLTFTEDGKISAEAGIAEWLPGNGGSSVIVPGN